MKSAQSLFYIIAYLAILALLPLAVFAQQGGGYYPSDREVNAELDRMYQRNAPPVVTNPAQISTAAAAPTLQNTAPPMGPSGGGGGGGGTAPSTYMGPAAPSAAIQARPGTHVNVNVQAQPQVSTTQTAGLSSTQRAYQSQPVTVIEGNMIDSRADQIRKSRQEAELATEQKIAEKLEHSRIEDERRRAETLFGDQMNVNQRNSQNQMVIQQPPVIMPVPVPPPQQQPPPPMGNDINDIRREIRESLRDGKREIEEPRHLGRDSYFAGIIGLGDYPGVSNVRGMYSLGVAFGKFYNPAWAIEGAFIYSNYQVEQTYDLYWFYNGKWYPRITNLNQYNFDMALKYHFLAGPVRPIFGGVMSYTYRTYADSQFAIANNSASSNSIDMGLVGGIDLALTPEFSLGFDVRYMWNLVNRTNNTGLQQSFAYNVLKCGTPIESKEYMNYSFILKTTF